MAKQTLQDWECTIVLNETCGADLKRMRLKPIRPESRFQCEPGQFVMLDLPLESFHFRRPFSVLSVQSDGSLDVYYKRVGKGTQYMWELGKGVMVRVLGPLGNPFPNLQEDSLYIGGGIGIAPLYFLSAQVTDNRKNACFYGTRQQSELSLLPELRERFLGALYLATDDGSLGMHGNVCDSLMAQSQRVQQAKVAYVCGPTPMMRAVVQLLNQLNPDLTIHVSLEEHMPCGTGACTGCVVKRKDQLLPSKVCQEGPVFNANQIDWGFAEAPSTVMVCPVL